jgi:hypothetical protein
MFNSQVLEVATGLIFVFLLLSVACSGIKEVIARVSNMRAKTLENGIRTMLADPNDAITSKLLQSHLIAGTAPPGEKPSYVSSRNFALALFDVLAPAAPGQSRTIQDLKTGIANLPDTRVRTTVLALIDSAQGNADLARQRVENWYDDTMDRVSGWYKRRAQQIIFVVGLVLCVLLNGDTLMIVHELWNDEALRSAVVAEAQERASAATVTSGKDDSLADVTQYIRDASAPPIGWSFSGNGARGLPESWGWLWKIIGILMTSVAIAMGAPFWFDLLNKIVNLRLTGTPPPDSRQPAGA